MKCEPSLVNNLETKSHRVDRWVIQYVENCALSTLTMPTVG